MVWLALSALTAAGDPSREALASPDPLALYGSRIAFDIQRKGRVIGTHVVQFHQTDAGLVTRSAVDMAVNVLFFPAFRYRYTADAVWREGGLNALTVETEENGRRSRLSARRDGETLAVSRGPVAFRTPAGIYPTEHWDAEILTQRQVLNTLTGRLNNVVIQQGEREYVDTERGAVAATHYLYTGDLAAEVWYDDEGRWVKMRFKARDGSTIEYRCRACQGVG
jgi:hypothetical protein